MANIVATDKPNAIETKFEITAHGEKIKFYITKPHQASKGSVAEWGKEDQIIPFFWVTTTAVEHEANMTFKHVNVDGTRIPVLTNNRIVKRMNVLQYFKEAAVKTPLEGVLSTATSSAPEPKAKGKKRPRVR
jgi:hypothetical protein